MFWSKKNTNPRGVPLGDLLSLLASTSIKARIKDNVLIAEHGDHITRLEVIPPAPGCIQLDSIKAVVRVWTELPTGSGKAFEMAFPGYADDDKLKSMLNKFAALGAIVSENGVLSIGSRLTIYEAEDAQNAWSRLHVWLLFLTVILGAEAQLGGFRHSVLGEPPRGGESAWLDKDFEAVADYLSKSCLCTTGGGWPDGRVCAKARRDYGRHGVAEHRALPVNERRTTPCGWWRHHGLAAVAEHLCGRE